jgi:hypothetical protein
MAPHCYTPVRAGTVSLLAGCAVLVSLAVAHAGKRWDRAANIGEAANRLVELHRAKGSQGVLKFLDACYKTHTLASEFKAPLEACMAQDYMHARVLVEIYGRLPEEARVRFNAPDAAGIELALNRRFALVMKQYAMSEADTQELMKSIETVGVPIFVKGVMPSSETSPADADAKREPLSGKP